MSWNLLGHEWAESLLREHLKRDELRHAYLITGAPGTGRRSLALALAKAVNCQNPPARGEFCGECRICRQVEKLQQPDLSIVEPETDGAMIKVDQVRELQHALSLAPYEAKYRVALLRNFHLANPSAQNALLKTLEEAPRQVILLLTADSAENVLPTIASRCEILRLRPLSVPALEKALMERWNYPAVDARLYAHLADGRVGKAISLAGNKAELDLRKAWLDDFVRLFGLNIRDRFALTDAISRSRDELRPELQTWLTYTRDLFLVSSRASTPLTNIDRESELRSLSAAMGSDAVLSLMKSLQVSLETLDQNANLKLMVDNLLLNIPVIKSM